MGIADFRRIRRENYYYVDKTECEEVAAISDAGEKFNYMYEQQILDSLLYIMLYGAVAMLSLAACCYLLLRRSNAIAPDVTSPVHLRRWTAVFFASMSLSHL